MRDLLHLAMQLFVTLARLARPGVFLSVIAESLLLEHQLIISGRSRRRAAPLTTVDRFVLGLITLFVRPRRVAKLAAILKPATLLRFHKALVDREYHRLFSSAGSSRKPGPKGPTEEIIAASRVPLGSLSLPGPPSPNITGHGTVAVFSRRRSPLDLEFAPHRR